MSKMIYRGNSVSQGVGIGGIHVCRTPEIIVNRDSIDEESVDGEIVNLEVAVCKTYIEIYDLYNGFADYLSQEEKRILDVYNAILDDVYFFEELKDTIKKDLIKAENAIDRCVGAYIREINESDNEYAKQRIADLKDIRSRLIKNVFPNQDVQNLENINSSHVLIVKELNPTLAVIIGKKKVQGVVAQEGAGFLSHASIILRGLGIPTINGIDFESILSYHDHIAVVDGFEGILLIEPDDPQIDRYREMVRIHSLQKKEFDNDPDIPIETADHYKVGLSANISNIHDYRMVQDKNMDGIGLIRTETLFIQNKKIPTEMRQTIVYSSFAKGMKKKPVVIRTFDIGGDKVPGNAVSIENWKGNTGRGIRWSLSHMEEFKIQLRSIAKASFYGNVKISIPMVDDVEEIRRTKAILEDEIACLNQMGYPGIIKIPIGAVIETKNAWAHLSEILDEVDFISIGTNDLLHSLMHINRGSMQNTIQAYFEPEFLQALHSIIHASKSKGLFVSVCGEMASDPLAAVVLIGLGVDDLSVAPSSIPYIKRTIRDLYYEVARELVLKIMDCSHLEEVMKILAGFKESKF
jgi:phosphoenolpyruvate-protein phosphotransferase (PTS system enzyme I)